ncbi:LrgB family protein [Massilia yuzhufengensis]|uniref:TIGR00659 family protein n=1 Tax=Massilia yuzhufengensis TaxID=1164594 RepID=A0A1I1QTP4_9BURK|nr:LrgB family protein [Massilia yuzhufengensis]SFD25486.1 TIGR00659 family protein [Massilia yuzhufengensis]
MPELANFTQFWVYLSASPLLGLTMTLCAYLLAQRLFVLAKGSPLANPVAIAIALVVLVLWLSGMSYQRYFAGAQFVHFLLGPATVALAVPLVRQLPRLRRAFLPLALALGAGCITAIVSAVAIALLLGATPELAASLGPKSATSPIAMAVSERLGGIPAFTAALVVCTGVFGAVLGPWIFDLLRIASPAARGFALGLASHGIGTARAFQASPDMGAFAGLAMGLNGALTALVAPVLVPALMRWLG